VRHVQGTPQCLIEIFDRAILSCHYLHSEMNLVGLPHIIFICLKGKGWTNDAIPVHNLESIPLGNVDVISVLVVV
jgi:hypothetical protein